MFDDSANKRAVFYCLAGLLGLCCALWFMFAFALTEIGRVPANQPLEQRRDSTHRISLSDDRPTKLPDQIKSVASHADTEKCSIECRSALSILNDGLALDDEVFHQLGAYVKEVAAHFQNDDNKRRHYLQMALTTASADKRKFLTDVFMHLPNQQKVELGGRYVGSENWQVRADGVTLIASDGVSNVNAANALMRIFLSEENSYIKGSILTYLKQDSALQGDVEILHQLDSVIYNDIDPSVRVAALKAKMHLSEQPYHVLPDALQALRTHDPEFQMAGLLAIEKILEYEKNNIEKGVYVDRNSIEHEFQIIRNLAVYDDEARLERLIREANLIYSRYFNQN